MTAQFRSRLRLIGQSRQKCRDRELDDCGCPEIGDLIQVSRDPRQGAWVSRPHPRGCPDLKTSPWVSRPHKTSSPQTVPSYNEMREASPPRREEPPKQSCALLGEHTRFTYQPMIQRRMLSDVEDGPRRARARIGRGVDQTFDPSMNHRAGTHGARLERHVQRRVQ